MPIRKLHTVTNLGVNEAPYIDQEFETLYRRKPEFRFYRSGVNGSAVSEVISTHIESGEITLSATGSPTAEKVIAISEPHNALLYAAAHALSTNVIAAVTDVTASSITIAIRGINGTNVSNDTTASVRILYQVIGSTP